MKVAMTSDNHYDINHVDLSETIKQQTAYLKQLDVDYYLNAGDLFNDFNKSLDFMERLQQALGPQIKAYFIAGNHDMAHGVTFNGLEAPNSDQYAHNKLITLNDETVLVSNNGWYDYSFARVAGKANQDYQQWKQAFWLDSVIEQQMSDPKRMEHVLAQTRFLLEQARGKQVIFMTHFVPRLEYIFQNPHRKSWDMALALMGSPKMGLLLQEYQVKAALFGHLHFRSPLRRLDNTLYFHQPVGYGLKRAHEWRSQDFMTEWKNSLQILNF